MYIYVFPEYILNFIKLWPYFLFLHILLLLAALIQLKLQVPAAVGLIKKLNLITSHKTNLRLYLWISRETHIGERDRERGGSR